MSRRLRRAGAVAVPLALVLAGSTAYATLSDAAARKPGIPTTGPFARTTAAGIRAKAAAAMKPATSVRVVGSVVTGGETFGIDLRIGRDADGVLKYSTGTIAIRRIGDKLYMSPDDAFYANNKHPEVIAARHGTWLDIVPADPAYATIMPLTHLSSWKRVLANVPARTRRPGATFGGFTTVAISGGKGPKAVTTFISSRGAALPRYALSADRKDRLAFLAWNAPVTARPVPAEAIRPELDDAVLDVPDFVESSTEAFSVLWRP